MGSPAYFGKLVNFTASLRKPAFIPFGTFSPGDNLSFIADIPTQGATFEYTTTPPDGSRTTFRFADLPIYVIWNGVLQFQNVGYTITGGIGNYVVTLIDYLGNVLTPGTTDSILAETTTTVAPSSTHQQSQASVAWASPLTINTAAAQVLSILLTGNVASTVLTYGLSAIPDGTIVELRFTQDGTGGWTVALPSNLNYSAGFAIDPTPSTTTVLDIRWNLAAGKWLFANTPFTVPGI